MLTATLTPSLALHNSHLGHAATVEPLAPEHLRTGIAAELSRSTRRYEGPAVMSTQVVEQGRPARSAFFGGAHSAWRGRGQSADMLDIGVRVENDGEGDGCWLHMQTKEPTQF